MSDPSSSPAPTPEQDLQHSYVTEQIRTALRPVPDADISEEDQAAEAKQREAGMLAAWAGLVQDGDAVEQMIAAQLVATHDLTMVMLRQAMSRAGRGRYAGESIRSVSRLLYANVRQIETLARYRTWQLQLQAPTNKNVRKNANTKKTGNHLPPAMIDVTAS